MSSRQVKLMGKQCNRGRSDPQPPNLGGAEPLHNLISAHGAGDAGLGMSREEFDPDGVAQRQVDKLN